MPAVMLNWGQTQIGRFCINLYLTLQEQGIYAVSFAIASTLIVATTAFRLAYDPFALSVMKQPDANIIYAKIYKLYVCIFGIVLSFLASLSQPLVNVLFPNSYLNAHTLIPLLATSFFYLGASNILATGIWVSGRTIYTSYAQAIAFFSLYLFIWFSYLKLEFWVLRLHLHLVTFYTTFLYIGLHKNNFLYLILTGKHIFGRLELI